MNQTYSDHDLKELMRRALSLIIKIHKASRWRLFYDDTAGWSFAGGGGDFYDGGDDAPRSQGSDLDAAWKALEESDDPQDIAMMKRIRERIRAKEGHQAG